MCDVTSDSPIVIGGAPSSGTTLLRTILGRIPSVVSGQELSVMDRPKLFEMGREELRRDFTSWLIDGFPCWYGVQVNRLFTNLDEFGWSREELINKAGTAENYVHLLDDFFRRAIELACKKRWLEKTPGNIFSFPEIETAFPGVITIQVLRDGRDVVNSLLRRGHSWFLAVTRWYTAAVAGSFRTSPFTVTVKYEELVADPQAVLTNLLPILGEDCDLTDAILRPDPSATRWLPTWHSSECGVVSTAAVGCHTRGEFDVETMHAFLGAISLTEEGMAALGLDGAVPPTAWDLLEQQGYCERPNRIRALTIDELQSAEIELERFRIEQARRCGALCSPSFTMLQHG
jgi:hypothetical protein